MSEPPPLPVDAELLALFVAEALDHLGTIESSVLALEASPDDREAINAVFRPFHTIKGNSAALGIHDVEELAHAVEDLLDRARSGERRIGSTETELILAAVDLLSAMIRDVEARAGGRPGTDLAAARSTLLGAIRRQLGAAAASQEHVSAQAALDGDPAAAAAAPLATIKVDTRKLDTLVDLVGELAIVQSMIHQDPHLTRGDERLNRNLAQLHRITTELQRGAIGMRLVPIRQTFQRMRRVVRDLSHKANKPVDLVISGEDTELDRKVVEEIADPLMHMIRNSMDHGIEDADARRLAGKPPQGRVTLSACYEGGNVVIAVSDDGRGLDTEKLYAKAAAMGLLEPGTRLTEAEAHALIFRAGFSTASEVTEVSGRGIGMDVVRRNVETLRGRIDIRSQAGAGTTFQIKLPLTLATLEGLLLGVGAERFVLPTFAVSEAFRPSRERLHAVPGSGWIVQIREELLPVVSLANVFSVAGAVSDPTEGAIVVIEDDGQRRALQVDRLLGKQEVVIKSLGEAFAHVKGVAGGAILADGRIGLILDAGGLMRLREHRMPPCAA
jgi:two-component system, chemotaxis family, sensor kinase CheA